MFLIHRKFGKVVKIQNTRFWSLSRGILRENTFLNWIKHCGEGGLVRFAGWAPHSHNKPILFVILHVILKIVC